MKFLLVLLLSVPAFTFAATINPNQAGAERLDLYLPLLKEKKVGLVVNQTSISQDQHLVDLLLSKGVQISKIFALEHGFRGNQDAGAIIKSGRDVKTGLPIHSLYGKQKKPSSESLASVDIIVFDIQDVGVRFYTYINSMFYAMQAAAEHNIPFVVLDRPNPNIRYVDGPMLEPQHQSFVGLLPIPLLHGMTVAELAQMIVGENWLNTINAGDISDRKLQLKVVPVEGYRRFDDYQLPVLPSPNLPNQQAITLYPSLCFFEATGVSIGRGTDFPFQVIGHDKIAIGEFQFTPRSIVGAASNPKLKGIKLTGMDLRNSNTKGLDLSLFYQWHQAFQAEDEVFFTRPSFMDKLAGTSQIRLDLQAGKSLDEIRAKWRSGIETFKRQRQAYLIYPE